MATTIYTFSQKVNSRGYFASNYYEWTFEVVLDSQDDSTVSSSITMNAYLGANRTGTGNAWSSSGSNGYYGGFTEIYNGVTTVLSDHQHASWANTTGVAYGKNLFETYTKTYAHDSDGNLDLTLIFNGYRKGTSTYVPVDVEYSSGALPVPAIELGKVKIKISGSWVKGQVWIKAGGSWHKAKKISINDNGMWKKSKV